MSNILVERLNQGPLICAEGFLFELERRGPTALDPLYCNRYEIAQFAR